jgi:hypothetical protein
MSRADDAHVGLGARPMMGKSTMRGRTLGSTILSREMRASGPPARAPRAGQLGSP